MEYNFLSFNNPLDQAKAKGHDLGRQREICIRVTRANDRHRKTLCPRAHNEVHRTQ